MLLLDTCAFVYDALAPKQLSRRARRTIEDAAQKGVIAISDITLWEIAMLVAKGRLDPGTDTGEFLRIAISARAVTIMPITTEIAVRTAQLKLHGDPADRLIAATAIEHRASLVTCDRALQRSREVNTVW